MLTHAVQELAFLLAVIAAIVGITEDIEGVLAAFVNLGGGLRGEERLQEGDGPPRPVRHQPALRRQAQQRCGHLTRGQGRPEAGFGEFREEEFPHQFRRYGRQMVNGAAALAIGAARATGAGQGRIGVVQRPRAEAAARQGRGIPDGPGEQEGEAARLQILQVRLLLLQAGGELPLRPAQEGQGLFIRQNPLQAEEEDILEGTILGERGLFGS